MERGGGGGGEAGEGKEIMEERLEGCLCGYDKVFVRWGVYSCNLTFDDAAGIILYKVIYNCS